MANIEDLPEHVLLDVLSLVPVKDLIRNCRLVCVRWRDVVDLPALWKRKYHQKASDLKKSKTFYIFSHLEKNLIKNPCGEEGLDFWDIKTLPQGQWKIKEVSEADSLKLQKWDFLQRNYYVKDEDIPHQHVKRCFAAYNGICTKSQLITLKDEGYWDELMDEGRPTIAVKDWFYSDLSNSYQLCVKLLSADFKVIREYCSNDLYKGDSDGEGWREVSYTFHNFPPGVRHIYFQHQGEKLNWWRARCGVSIARCVRITKMRSKNMRITKSSVTVGPFSLDKAMYGREGRDLSVCVRCPCRGNYIHFCSPQSAVNCIYPLFLEGIAGL
ncbi:F-box only protein 44-like [Elgaria multicarinata webbii]|uniref:F-box only protein 44-like n=1 Tax=Elgaria multicarinata webbii TaxID=159646 RepID=UPI002FCCE1CB